MTARRCVQWLLASIACLPGWALAQPAGTAAVPVGRYSTVAAAPRLEQLNPLSAMVTVAFPRRTVRTVGEALQHLLRQSGYRLAAAEASDPALQILVSRPLPAVQRQLGPCRLQDGLTTLAGPIYRLVVDPPHRLVSFELTDPYRTLIHDSDAAQAREATGNATLRR